MHALKLASAFCRAPCRTHLARVVTLHAHYRACFRTCMRVAARFVALAGALPVFRRIGRHAAARSIALVGALLRITSQW